MARAPRCSVRHGPADPNEGATPNLRRGRRRIARSVHEESSKLRRLRGRRVRVRRSLLGVDRVRRNGLSDTRPAARWNERPRAHGATVDEATVDAGHHADGPRRRPGSATIFAAWGGRILDEAIPT